MQAVAAQGESDPERKETWQKVNDDRKQEYPPSCPSVPFLSSYASSPGVAMYIVCSVHVIGVCMEYILCVYSVHVHTSTAFVMSNTNVCACTVSKVDEFNLTFFIHI